MRLPKRCLLFDSEARPETRNTYTVTLRAESSTVLRIHGMSSLCEAEVKPDTAVVSGCGSMSRAPHYVDDHRGGWRGGAVASSPNIHSELNFSFSPI